MNYLKLLEHSYEIEKRCDADLTRTEYLSDNIFDFDTYDGKISSLFAKKAVKVCSVITERKTFEHIKNKENYKWYLLMVNMPFFQGKLEWETSIRCAWWDLYGDDEFILSSFGLYVDEKQILELRFREDQWKDFIMTMVAFIQKDKGV